jgi:signal transduction histidine kinase
MHIYINRKLLTGLIIAFAIICTLGVASYLFFAEFVDTARWGGHARSVLYKVEKGRALFHEFENARLRSILRKHPPVNLESGLGAFYKNLNELDSLLRDNSSQQQRVREIRDIAQAGVQLSDSVSSGMENAEQLRMLRQEIIGGFNSIETAENELIKERSILASDRFTQFGFAIIGLILSTLILLAFLTYGINSTLRSRIQSEEMLREAEQATQKVNAELESFTYSVSHDLRAPLRSIDGYSQILKEEYGDKVDKEGNRLIGVVINNARRMGHLIDDLLDFSRVGRKELLRSTIDMNEFVKPILDELLEHEKERKIAVDLRAMGRANVDIGLFRQVWVNLISNAIKYSRNKESAVVEIGLSKINGDDTYYIKDNGAGFDMQYSNKLFRVFQRLHKVTEFEGTGVGLALVKRIVERHKGRIWAESEVDKGSTFYFHISKS